MTFTPQTPPVTQVPTWTESFVAPNGGGYFPVDTSSGDLSVQVPDLAVATGVYQFKNMGSNVLTIIPAGTDKVDGEDTLELVDQYASAAITPGDPEWLVF